MTRIIAAIDNSAGADAVLAVSSALALEFGAVVEAVHVSDDGGETARACAERHGIAFREVGGDLLAAIVDLATADDVVAVSVGRRHEQRARHVAHVGGAVADAIDKPVLVVPPEARAPERLRTVVVAMEGTARQARSLKQAISLADESNLDLVVVHVDDETSIPSFSDQVAHETEAYAEEFLARHLTRPWKARLELRVGLPAHEIIGVADDEAADVLAVGWPQNAAVDRGAVARELLDRSHVPVLLVALAEPNHSEKVVTT